MKPAWRDSLILLVCWLGLSAWLNVRYPGHEAAFSWLLPSLDASALLALIAVLGERGRKLGTLGRVTLLALLLLTKLLRVGDGFQERYFFRPFNLYSDLRLVPNLARLFWDTLPAWQFAAGGIAVAVTIVASVAALWFVLRRAERCLEARAVRRNYGAALLAGMLISPLVPVFKYETNVGAFSQSAVPRLAQEVDFLLHVGGYRTARLKSIADVQTKLGAMSTGLDKLQGANVFLFLIESYGRVVFTDATFAKRMVPQALAFESRVKASGFEVLTSALKSPTLGGSSWRAQATLGTGVWVEDEFAHALLFTTAAKPIASFFKAAGYRTVLMQPGTRTPPTTDFFQFDRRYYPDSFAYAGPALGWGQLPDQFSIDFLHHKEVLPRKAPLFIQYCLVSSHAPWAVIPPVIDDASQITDGSIYQRVPPQSFDTSYADLTRAADAYLAAITYDFEVLARYIAQQVPDNSLVVVLGDHQPVADIVTPAVASAGAALASDVGAPSHDVPIHVISKRTELLEPFAHRGYSRGILAQDTGPYRQMDQFLLDLLQDFSTQAEKPKG